MSKEIYIRYGRELKETEVPVSYGENARSFLEPYTLSEKLKGNSLDKKI